MVGMLLCVKSSDRLKPILGNQGEELQGCALRMFFAAFPLADQARCHVEIAREHRLTCALPQTKGANFFGFQRADEREAQIIKLAHRALVHHPGSMEAFGGLMNRGH